MQKKRSKAEKKLLTIKLPTKQQWITLGLLLMAFLSVAMVIAIGLKEFLEYMSNRVYFPITDYDPIYLLTLILILSFAKPAILLIYFIWKKQKTLKIYSSILLISLIAYPIISMYAVHSYFKSLYFANFDFPTRITIAVFLLLSSLASLVSALLLLLIKRFYPISDSLAISKTDVSPILIKTIKASTAVLFIAALLSVLTFLVYSSYSESILLTDEEKAYFDCASIKNKRGQYKCFAEFFNDLKQCEELSESLDNRRGVYDYSIPFCASIIAIKDNNYKLCKTYGYQGDFTIWNCLGNLAFYRNDFSICNKSAELDGKNTREIKEMCYERFAIYTGNYDVCKQIKDKETYELCIAGAAEWNKDKEKCKEIENEELMNYCISHVDNERIWLDNYYSIKKRRLIS